MAYLLSKHLAALTLNATCGPISELGLVAVDCGDGNGPTLVSDLIADANIVLCMGNLTPGNDATVADVRQLQEEVKDCLDAINSNKGRRDLLCAEGGTVPV